MKTLIIISSFLLLRINGFGQEEDIPQFRFYLNILKVTDFDSKKELGNVNIKIVGTDSSSREFTSDSLGEFPIIPLKAKTTYSTLVSKEGYLNARGKESTFILRENVYHEYSLIPTTICYGSPVFSTVTYKLNHVESFSADSSYKLFLHIMNENPTMIVQIKGYRKTSEKKSISQKRATYYAEKVISMGIDKTRMEVFDGGQIKDLDRKNNFLQVRVISYNYQLK